MRRLAPLAFLALLTGCTVAEELTPAPTGSSGPSADVELVTDDLGVTHVYGASDADAMFGAGYAMARDRLFHMELVRRQALGRAAEIFGDVKLRSDVASRTMNFAALGLADYEDAREKRPEEAALVEAWAAGVNRRIDEVARGEAPRPYGLRASELDFVPEPWKASDAYMIGKLLAFGISSTLDYEILATAIMRIAPQAFSSLPLLMPAYDAYTMKDANASAGAPPAPPKPPAFPAPIAAPPPFRYERLFPAEGSNNWAVDGAHSKNARPWLCGDPHQPLTSPTRLWPVHVSSAAAGGTLDVVGFTFVGTPMVELGHNAHIGWTATTNYADVMDLWDVKIAGDFEAVSLGGKARPLQTRSEIIKVRKQGAAFGDDEDYPLDVHESPGLGVILPEKLLPVPKLALADGELFFAWTGFSPTSESAAYLALDRARSLDDFEKAADLLQVGAVNFVAADAKGIGYHVHARIPDRGDPASHPMPWHVLAGSDAESLWTRGDLSKDKLPHLRDPARGFISTANNDPWGFTADGDVSNDPFYYGAFYATNFRAARIHGALEGMLAARLVDRADMEALQRDVRSPMADTLLPHLAAAMTAAAADPALSKYAGRADLAELFDRLSQWDRNVRKGYATPVIFEAFAWYATKRVLEPLLTSLLFDAIGEASPPFLHGMLINVLERRYAGADALLAGAEHAILLAALDDTAQWLATRFGSTTAHFTRAELHFADFPTDFGGAFTVEPVPVDGSFDTINVSPAPFFQDGVPRDRFLSHEGSLYRMVLGFSDDGTPEATIDFARGASADPASPHFADQEATWAAAEHVPLAFRRADVDARATARAVIEAR